MHVRRRPPLPTHPASRATHTCSTWQHIRRMRRDLSPCTASSPRPAGWPCYTPSDQRWSFVSASVSCRSHGNAAQMTVENCLQCPSVGRLVGLPGFSVRSVNIWRGYGWAHILWGHSGPLCHALSLLSSLSWTSMHRRRATVATPGEWQCKTARRMSPTFFKCFLLDMLSVRV